MFRYIAIILSFAIYWWNFFFKIGFKEDQRWFKKFIKKISIVGQHYMTGVRGFIGIIHWFVPPEAVGVDLSLFSIGVSSDFFDGPIARHLKAASAFGDFWDGLNDKIFVLSYCLKWMWRLNLSWEFRYLFYGMIALEASSYIFIGSKWLYFFLVFGEKKKDLFAHPKSGKWKCGMQCVLGALLGVKTYFSPDLKMLYLYSDLTVCTLLTFLSAKEKMKKLFA